MPPQQPMPPINQPAPNAPYDFILQDPQAPKKKLGLPGGSQPVKILIGLVGLVFVVIILAVILKGHGGVNTKAYAVVDGQAQEIIRVSDLVSSQTKDANTRYLAATTKLTMESQSYLVGTYLASRHTKVSNAQLALYTNKDTDAQLTAAASNNNLEATYDAYLKTSLTAYQASLQTAAKGAGKKGLAILNFANNSTVVLLSSPQITSLSGTGS